MTTSGNIKIIITITIFGLHSILEMVEAQPFVRLPVATSQVETTPGFFEVLGNLDLTKSIPDSPFLRLAVHILRALLVGVILCLWFIFCIQIIVCFANCCVCYGGGKKSTDSKNKEQGSTSSSSKDSESGTSDDDW